MKANILKLLLQSHADGDEPLFRKAALQLAAAESSAGHVQIAEELRSILAKMPATSTRKVGPVVDIATPRGDLADILEGGHREERLRDIVLHHEVRDLLLRVISENRSRARLERFGVSPRRRLLFHGPPGCGKTLAAAVLAGEMGLPLMTVRFDALFSRFLGSTATQLRVIFAEMPRRPGVYFFDEFDSVAKARGDSQDVGEMNRVVTAFLQLVDADQSGSILVAATNHVELLDRAMFRRFDVVVPLEKPTREQLVDLLKLRLETFGLTGQQAEEFAQPAEGWSFADVARACDDAVRTMALEERNEISEHDVVEALEELKRRKFPSRECYVAEERLPLLRGHVTSVDTYQSPRGGGGTPPKLPAPNPMDHRRALLQQLDTICQQVRARTATTRDELARSLRRQTHHHRSGARLVGSAP